MSSRTKNRKPTNKVKSKKQNTYKHKTSMRQKLVTLGVIGLALLFAFSMFMSAPKAPKRAPVPNRTAAGSNTNNNADISKPKEEPQFVNEGSLSFIVDGKAVKKIDVEVADNEADTQQGLMFRTQMAENRGMLFVFPDMDDRSFWMKNTIIPLDIIYVDDQKKIVSIQKNAKPHSEAGLPSEGPAKFVVEVNAGFTDRYNIKPGDIIDGI